MNTIAERTLKYFQVKNELVRLRGEMSRSIPVETSVAGAMEFVISELQKSSRLMTQENFLTQSLGSPESFAKDIERALGFLVAIGKVNLVSWQVSGKPTVAYRLDPDYVPSR